MSFQSQQHGGGGAHSADSSLSPRIELSRYHRNLKMHLLRTTLGKQKLLRDLKILKRPVLYSAFRWRRGMCEKRSINSQYSVAVAGSDPSDVSLSQCIELDRYDRRLKKSIYPDINPHQGRQDSKNNSINTRSWAAKIYRRFFVSKRIGLPIQAIILKKWIYPPHNIPKTTHRVSHGLNILSRPLYYFEFRQNRANNEQRYKSIIMSF